MDVLYRPLQLLKIPMDENCLETVRKLLARKVSGVQAWTGSIRTLDSRLRLDHFHPKE